MSYSDPIEIDFEEQEKRLGHELEEWLPKKEDKLFQNTFSSARVDPIGLSDPLSRKERSPTGRWGLYCEGFRLAADRLVEGLTGSPQEDALIYPLLALYRHHIELALKELIRSCPAYLSDLSDAEIEKKLQKVYATHSLRSLWSALQTLYLNCNDWTSEEGRKAFEHLLFELDDHDPHSQAGRYPMDKKGTQTLTRLISVDLPNLKAGVHKISHYLDCIYEGIGREAEWRSEQASW